jgi:hypothetical protein
MFKSRMTGWAGVVSHMGAERNICRILVGKPEGKYHWEDLNKGGWILKWKLEKYNRLIWIGLM